MGKHLLNLTSITAYLSILTLSLITSGCDFGSNNKEDNSSYTIASPQYAVLAEKSLDFLTSFDFESWGTLLSDSVEYNFPDGDINTRTVLKGKKTLLAWWKNYKNESGLESMSLENANYLPINTTVDIKDGLKPGTYVYSYFSNKMVYKGSGLAVRMNFVFHFDQAKMIDNITTYYDRTPIIKAMNGKNYLDLSEKKE
jgi:hypothetical protein